MGGEGINTPSNEGRAYTSVTLDTAGEPESLLPATTETGSVAIKAWNLTGDAVYIGWDDQVTIATGFPIEDGQSISLELDNSEQQIWAVSEQDGEAVKILATN